MGITSHRLRKRIALAANASPVVHATTAERLAARGAELATLRIENSALRARVTELETLLVTVETPAAQVASQSQPHKQPDQRKRRS